MKNKIWKMIYSLLLGKEEVERILGNRKIFMHYILQATNGGVATFYNVNGEQIRGYFKPVAVRQHPLIKKYY